MVMNMRKASIACSFSLKAPLPTTTTATHKTPSGDASSCLRVACWGLHAGATEPELASAVPMAPGPTFFRLVLPSPLSTPAQPHPSTPFTSTNQTAPVPFHPVGTGGQAQHPLPPKRPLLPFLFFAFGCSFALATKSFLVTRFFSVTVSTKTEQNGLRVALPCFILRIDVFLQPDKLAELSKLK
ncbi:hypothetical protein CAOG_009415 [Capsaspora owczarzaki ATCC 30864]|uniref:Uncharacterized protein n=1 Tax=Capsaspora owczarzaki (strain ATCC 30864) TaxID=595528 RepID=A0A0D2X0Z8_CAPO3|nr:hypothetical protein CAOG_009415 [Capsaspora owczarzaki ATCC 30864]